MKIFEIIPDLNRRAGAEVFFHSLCNQLAKDGSLEVVVVIIWDKIDASFKDLETNPRLKFYCCGKRKKGIDFKAIRKFKEILIKEKPDVVHTHRSVLLTYFLAFGFKKNTWRYYHTVHNIADKEAGKYEIFLRKMFLKRHLISHIGISDEISKSIKNTYKSNPVATIYNGIDFKPILSSKKVYDFICIARFSRQKNHMFLLSCFLEFLKIFPDSKMLLVGEGELQAECKDFCVKNYLDRNVVFYGSTPSVEPLLAQSKFFVLGSLYEGNPISILEAMASGLPIIAPRVGGIPDVVEDRINGLLFEVNDSKQLVDNMERMFEEISLQKEIAKNNIAKSNKFLMENCAVLYKKVFTKY